MKVLRHLDELLNKVTIYRLVVYGLCTLLACGIAFCFSGILSFSGIGLLISSILLVCVCYGMNRLLAYLYHAPSNSESSLITALILACILPPVSSSTQAIYVTIAGAIAIISKYVISWHHKHIFNPAAAGAVSVALIGILYATWWIGTPPMLPLVVILGFLILRKVRHARLFISFTLASMAMSLVIALVHDQSIGGLLRDLILSGPLVFLGTVMLTEPSTLPPSGYFRLLYGALVGVLFTAQVRFGSLALSPELSLLIGNVLAYSVSFKMKITMVLREKMQLSPTTYNLAFVPSQQFVFRPGQYLEWTLPHHPVDQRGNRRTFTIASSPTEQQLCIGVKFYKHSSSFKNRLLKLEPGDRLVAGQLAGEFTLPDDSAQKLVWIAGGIGITPFRSMTQYLIDTQQTRDIVLFYFVSQPDEICYPSVFEKAKHNGLKTLYVLSTDSVPTTWQGLSGLLTKTLLKQEVADYLTRCFYISGPNSMVQAYKDVLRAAHVPASKIKTDYFSGY